MKKADLDVNEDVPGCGAIDGVLENALGDVGLCEVKVRRIGRAEKEAARSKVRKASQDTFEAFETKGAAASWAWGVVVTCFVVSCDVPSADDYVMVEWWPKEFPDKVKSKVFRNQWSRAEGRSRPRKPCLMSWQIVKAALLAKPGAVHKEGRCVHFKVSAYLELHSEKDAAGYVARWKDKCYLQTADVLKRKGATVKKGFGASVGKAKGASKALFLSCATLRHIHEARLSGNL